MMPAILVANQPPRPALLLSRPRPVEILLLAWGVFFIAAHDTAPKQKARVFSIATKAGKDSIATKAGTGPISLKESGCLSTVASDRTCDVDDRLDLSPVTDHSAARHRGHALDTWQATGNRYGGGEGVDDHELDISQATDNSYGGHQGVVDYRLDISQPSRRSYDGDDASVNESYV